jgi:hypothetical protein
VVRGNTCRFARPFLGGIENLARNHATIADGNDNHRVTVVEHQSAGVQTVVNAGGLAVLHAAVD